MKTFLLLGLLLTAAYHVHAQVVHSVDTIEWAREEAYKKRFDISDSLLQEFNRSQNNVYGLRLHAQVLYWMKEFDRSLMVYEKALALFPEEKMVALEYGRVLFELNKMVNARKMLEDYLKNDSLHAEANILIAKIDLWSGHIQAAKKRALFILQHYPGNAEAGEILAEVARMTTPHVKKPQLNFLLTTSPAQGLLIILKAVSTGQSFFPRW